MSPAAADRRRIAALARRIARAESVTGTVAPSHVIRAAIEAGWGTLARTLTDGLRGQRACGMVRTADEWQASIEAMLAGGWLYVSGGRWVYVERMGT